MPHVHVQPIEGDAGGDDAVQLVGPDLGMEQAVAERRCVEHLRLAGCNDAVALQAGKVPPDGGREQVASEVIAGDTLQYAGSLALGCSFGAFQGCLGGLHALFEGIELALADALDAQAQCGLLADDELVLGFVPLAAAVFGEATNGHGFVANPHRTAFGLELAIDQDLRFQADAGRDRAGQLAGVGDVGGDERFDGLLVGRAGGHPGQGEFLAGQAGGGRLEFQDGVVAPGGASLVGVDAVFELGPQVVGHFAELLGAGLDGVGQGAGQVGQGVDLRIALAQHVADGAVAGVLAGDVGFEASLVGVELALQGCGVEVLHPAFGLVDLRALLGGIHEGVGIERHGGTQVHAGLEGVLLVAAVQGHPGVGAALAGGVAGASAGLVLDEGFDPGVFDAQGFGLRAGDQGNVADAALAPDLLGCVYVVHPLVDRVGVVAQGLGQGFDGGGRNGQ